MPLVTSKSILANALRDGYAVGAFNAHNLEMAQAVVRAAEEENAPVILQISLGTIRHAGLETAAALAKSIARRAAVPVVLHLDHGTDFEINMRCLREGFTSLMYDGSKEDFEENVRVTRMVVEAAHACGVPVEAELGRIPRIGELAGTPAGRPPGGLTQPGGTGPHGGLTGPGEPSGPGGSAVSGGAPLPPAAREQVERLFASPVRAAEFVRLTGCDSLAAACGSVHGMTADVQPLDVSLVAEIASRTGVPLVLHGSSGVIRSREDAERRGLSPGPREGGVREAVRSGVAKVNVSTELQVTYLDAVRARFERDPGGTDVREVFARARDALTEKVRYYIRMFGSSGKA
jgi:fructose-bisphosphate aldolase class II